MIIKFLVFWIYYLLCAIVITKLTQMISTNQTQRAGIILCDDQLSIIRLVITCLLQKDAATTICLIGIRLIIWCLKV